MKEYILMEATSSSKKYQKKYKCPYCDLRFIRSKLPGHIQDKHEDLIPEGYTALRVAFNTINNKDHGSCIICGNETAWNEIKGRYERLCENPACKEKYKQIVAKRNRDKYGTDRLQTDERYASDVQKKALAGRKISGKYKFADGGEVEYVGSYERKLLEFMDKIMKCNSEDILSPGPDIKYMWEGKEHLYIPDFYYIPYNLIIEVKDGQGNKNQNPNVLAYNNERQKAKEQAVIDSKKYSYVKITNNDFSQLIGVFGVLKYQLLEKDPDPVIQINESTILEQKINSPKVYHISASNMNNEILHPRIPDNYFTKNGYEDNMTPRVCFSESIPGCIMAINTKQNNAEFYVHVPYGSYDVITPTKKQVPDVEITKERWICSDVKIKCIGKIRTWDKGEPGIKFKYGNKTAELYEWDYEWIEKYDKDSISESSNISLSSFGRIEVTDKSINDHKSEAKYLKHFRTDKDYKGYIYLDKDTVVCALNVNIKTGLIQAIEISKNYQGIGLSYQILDVCCKELKATHLTVRKYNKIAIHVYEKYGFEIYKEDKNSYYMKLKDVSIDMREATIKEQKSIFKHMEEISNPTGFNFYNSLNEVDESMSGTIGAALPLTPSPVPYESNKDNYYIIQHMQNNVFNYSITKDPTQYTMYSIDPEHGYKVFKSDKNKIQKSYLTFKLKDKRSAKEIYDEISDCFKSGKSVPSMNYIYEKYTGNKIISEDQILFDDKLELIPNFYDGINEICNELYKYLTPSGLDILEEQVNQLKEVVYFG